MERRIVRAVLLGTLAATVPGIAVAYPGQEPPPPPPDPFVADAEGATFVETFDSLDSLDRFDWFVHNAANFHERPDHWHGDHDENCGPPTSTRDVSFPDAGTGTHLSTDRGELAYWCAPGGDGTGHMMTSFNTAGYGQVDFAPAQRFTDVRTVCWDQNQTNLGNRKWTQLVVVPEEEFQAHDERLDYVVPRVQDGPGSAGIKLTQDVFLLEMVQGSTVVHVGQQDTGVDFGGVQTIDDKARRFTTCVTDLENGNVRIELERVDDVEVRELGGSFPDGDARVIFQDDNYNPKKAENPALVPDPFTWHWDDIIVKAGNASPQPAVAREPAVPSDPTVPSDPALPPDPTVAPEPAVPPLAAVLAVWMRVLATLSTFP